MSVEPSMEEILSSIKRIIAEEGDGPTRGRRLSRPAPPPRDDDHEVLELRDPMPEPARPDFARVEPGFDRRPEPAPVEPVRADPARIEPARVEPIRPEAVARTESEPTSRVEASRPEPVAPARSEDEPIISASAAEASRGSLENLSRLLVKPDPASDGTLEGMVRDMLRPMLRDWLDRNLPAMVETMVADEIARITGQPR
ncbi:hypothetical protein ASG07_05225 [Sphingomonas sp. Leaf343]|nr:DUF2497 domain-containing protein [Sphingomonas sp. Leaf343]KQR84013.1 hypothetical protein ASG07_05225 [Sphingomonas sp. Leaf343]